MALEMTTVLVVGASGSIGRQAVAAALNAGYETKALVRNDRRAASFPTGTRVVIGDLTKAETLRDAVRGVTGIVFTHGSYGSPVAAEARGLRSGAERAGRHGGAGAYRVDDGDRGDEAQARP